MWQIWNEKKHYIDKKTINGTCRKKKIVNILQFNHFNIINVYADLQTYSHPKNTNLQLKTFSLIW